MNYQGDYIVNNQDPNSNNNDFDLQHYLGLFLSNWYWFALALFCSGLLAYGINTYSERIYTVYASLLIKDDQNADLTGLDKIIPGGDLFRSQQNLQNEIGILKSFNVNLRVMEELPEFHVTVIGVGRRGIAQARHYKSAPFIVVYNNLKEQRPGIPINIRIKSDSTFSLDLENFTLSKKEFSFGEKIIEAGFDFKLIKRDSVNYKYDGSLSNRYIIKFNNPEWLANSYRNKLQIAPINQEATLVTLSVTGVVPLQEADYLNTLMDIYSRQGLEYKNLTAEKTIEFIDEQLKEIADSLAKDESKLEKFRLSNNLIDLSLTGTAISEKLKTYAQEKVTADLQKQYYDYLDGYLESKNVSDEIISPSAMGVTDPLLISLVDDITSLENQKKQLSYNFTENQPAISYIDSRIRISKAALRENIKNNQGVIKNIISSINSRISAVESEMKRLPGTERRLINIQRGFDLNNTVYTYLLEKKSEAGIAKASTVPGCRVIDKAAQFNTSLVKPKSKRNYMFAIMLGLLLPGIYIFLVDQLHNKILDKKDIVKGTKVPIVGFVGHSTSPNDLLVKEKPGSSIAESFRTMRTNLKYYLGDNKKAVISVTSTISGEGKTFISMNLAAVLAMVGKKTLLMGVDLRKPRLDKLLNLYSGKGLSTYIIGDCSYEDIITTTNVENLYYAPSGPIPPNPSELLESERMTIFLTRAREEFDFIVMDTPPVGIVSDAILLGNFSTVNIFVIRQKFSFKSTLELIQNIYEKRELKNLTIAVNDIHVSGYYGYGLRYGYGFYQGYGYNYGYGQYGSYYLHGESSKYYSED